MNIISQYISRFSRLIFLLVFKNYIKDVTDITKTVRNVNDLNIAIRDFEHLAFKINEENSSLKYQIELKMVYLMTMIMKLQIISIEK